jgi:hypothetical protein
MLLRTGLRGPRSSGTHPGCLGDDDLWRCLPGRGLARVPPIGAKAAVGSRRVSGAVTFTAHGARRVTPAMRIATPPQPLKLVTLPKLVTFAQIRRSRRICGGRWMPQPATALRDRGPDEPNPSRDIYLARAVSCWPQLLAGHSRRRCARSAPGSPRTHPLRAA